MATAALVILPLPYLLVRAGEKGLEAYAATVLSPWVGALLQRTLLLVAAVVGLTVILALPLAWLVVRTDLPGRRWWAVLGALPLAFPSYVAAFAFIAALGPRGYLQGWLAEVGVERLPPVAYGFSGALLALGLFTFPYVYLPLVAALRDLDPALEESARALGARPWRAFWSVVVPQLRPALYAGSLLVALYTLSDFGAVSIVRYNTFTLAIYNAYRGLYDRSVAASLATVLVGLTVVLLLVEALGSRRARPHRRRPARPAPRVCLGRWRWPAVLFPATLVALTVGLPLAVVAAWGARGLGTGGVAAAGRAAVHSLAVSLAAAVVAMLLSLPVSAWSVRAGGALARGVERLTYAGYALPGLVIALSLVYFAARQVPALYQTIPLLIIAYVVRFLPEATASTRSAMVAVSPRFEEAALTLGRGPTEVLRSLTLPMILPGVLVGGGLVFLTTMKELPATLLLRPSGFETLATEVWSYASEAIYTEAALPALGLVVVTAPAVYALVIRPAVSERGA